jgi:hypothetical protein
MTDIRAEIHALIDALPERALYALRPLLSFLADEYWKPIIEPADPDEIALIEEGMAEYRANPSSFVPLESIR